MGDTKPYTINGVPPIAFILRGIEILMVAALAIMGYLASQTLEGQTRRLNIVEATLASRGERIARLESAYTEILRRLDRMEQKLDDHQGRSR